MKIGIDIDEVVAKYAEGYLEIFQREYGKAANFENISSYNFNESLGISKEESDKLNSLFINSEIFDNLKLIEGARESVIELSKQHDIIFITFRPMHLKEKTKNFIEKIFPNHSFEIFYAREFPNKSKAKACNSLGVNVILEDHAPAALDCANNGVKVFLFDKPWNKGTEHENIIRVRNWQEVLKKLK